MAEYQNLQATLDAQIKANGVGAITGPVLNAVLSAMVNVLGNGYRLIGVADPSVDPGSPDNRVAYLAGVDGTYTDFDGITLSGEVALLLWDSAWSKQTLFTIDAAASPGSANLITSGAVAEALAGVVLPDGHYTELVAGFAANIYDRRSAGTPQSFAFRQSGGDGVNYLKRIKGKTLAWNQLVAVGTTEVPTISGRKYLTIISGVASIVTSTGADIAIDDDTKDNVFDLTLMFGAGNEPTTVDQFRALHPLPYYNYNAGVLKNNAATGLETVGFNQWDEEWKKGDFDNNGVEIAGIYSISANYIPIVVGKNYCISKQGLTGSNIKVYYYDAGKAFISVSAWLLNASVITPPTGCAFIKFAIAVNEDTYNNDICINISDASRNGIYEPHWKRDIVLGLDNLACHDENNNAVVVNGLDGVGTAQDELLVENGWGTKINKRMAVLDWGDLDWRQSSAAFYASMPADSAGYSGIGSNARSTYLAGSKYNKTIQYANLAEGGYCIANNSYIYVKDSSYATPAAFKTAVEGIKMVYELATPKVLTLDNPIPALIEVDDLGTEKRLPEDTADNPQAPFECDSNYSISVANLVRKLNE